MDKHDKIWIEALNLDPKIFQNCPPEEPVLVWGLKNGSVDEQAYLAWASEYYELPVISPQFFARKWDNELVQTFQHIHQWSETCFPVDLWEKTLFVACLEPQAILSDQPICYVLSPYQTLIENGKLTTESTDSSIILAPPFTAFDSEDSTEIQSTDDAFEPPPNEILPKIDLADLQSADDFTKDFDVPPPPMDFHTIPNFSSENLTLDLKSADSKEEEIPPEEFHETSTNGPGIEFTSLIPRPPELNNADENSLNDLDLSSLSDFDANSTPALPNLEKDVMPSEPSEVLSDFDFSSLNTNDEDSAREISKEREKTLPENNNNQATEPIAPPIMLSVDTPPAMPKAPIKEPSMAAVLEGLPQTPRMNSLEDNIPRPPSASLPTNDLSAKPSEISSNHKPTNSYTIPDERKWTTNDIEQAGELGNASSLAKVLPVIVASLTKDFKKIMWLPYNTKNKSYTPQKVFGDWSPTDQGFKTPVNLSEANIFKIAHTTRLPFHGHIHINPTNQNFFDQWTHGVIPDHITIYPLMTGPNNCAGLILGAEKEDRFHFQLTLSKMDAMFDVATKRLSGDSSTVAS